MYTCSGARKIYTLPSLMSCGTSLKNVSVYLASRNRKANINVCRAADSKRVSMYVPEITSYLRYRRYRRLGRGILERSIAKIAQKA